MSAASNVYLVRWLRSERIYLRIAQRLRAMAATIWPHNWRIGAHDLRS